MVDLQRSGCSWISIELYLPKQGVSQICFTSFKCAGPGTQRRKTNKIIKSLFQCWSFLLKSTQDYHTTRVNSARGSRQIWDSLAQHTYVCTWWWKSRLGDLPRYAWEEFSLPHQRLSPEQKLIWYTISFEWLFKKQVRELMISLGKVGKDREEFPGYADEKKGSRREKQGLEEHLEMEGATELVTWGLFSIILKSHLG